MAEPPITLPQLQQIHFDPVLWTATAVSKPAVVLLQHDERIVILLAKQLVRCRTGTALRAVQMIEFPRGLPLLALHIGSRLFSMHLPDEFRFNRVDLIKKGRWHGARVERSTLAQSLQEFPMRRLTRGEYRRLRRMSGRQLLAALAKFFPNQVAPLGEPRVATLLRRLGRWFSSPAQAQ